MTDRPTSDEEESLLRLKTLARAAVRWRNAAKLPFPHHILEGDDAEWALVGAIDNLDPLDYEVFEQ